MCFVNVQDVDWFANFKVWSSRDKWAAHISPAIPFSAPAIFGVRRLQISTPSNRKAEKPSPTWSFIPSVANTETPIIYAPALTHYRYDDWSRRRRWSPGVAAPDHATVCIWLYEQLGVRIEGKIRGFDEFLNLVLDEAVLVHQITKTRTEESRTTLGRILLKGDNITLIQSASN
ncbi:hypothetical protein G7046_g5473 [Stylonectria norvegica]|nr:hypothetical protein G7046_g5473 [Stylonectria norvegica]